MRSQGSSRAWISHVDFPLVKRRFFNVLAGVSLLLCVTMVTLWARSYRVADSFAVKVPPHSIAPATHQPFIACELDSYRGIVRFMDVDVRFGIAYWRTGIRWGWGTVQPQDAPRFWTDIIPLRQQHTWLHAGFGYAAGRARGFYYYPVGAVAAPDWVLVILTAVIPCLWVDRFRRRVSRLRGGLCPSCGYDLRATPARCPECGTATAGAGISNCPNIRPRTVSLQGWSTPAGHSKAEDGHWPSRGKGMCRR